MSPETIRCLLKFAVEIRPQFGCGRAALGKPFAPQESIGESLTPQAYRSTPRNINPPPSTAGPSSTRFHPAWLASPVARTNRETNFVQTKVDSRNRSLDGNFGNRSLDGTRGSQPSGIRGNVSAPLHATGRRIVTGHPACLNRISRQIGTAWPLDIVATIAYSFKLTAIL